MFKNASGHLIALNKPPITWRRGHAMCVSHHALRVWVRFDVYRHEITKLLVLHVALRGDCGIERALSPGHPPCVAGSGQQSKILNRDRGRNEVLFLSRLHHFLVVLGISMPTNLPPAGKTAARGPERDKAKG